MDLKSLAEEHRARWAGVAADVRNVRPSIRDIERHLTTRREELAVVGELRRRDPDRGPLAAITDAPAFAAEVEGGGAYGVCVCVDEAFGGSLEDLRAVSAAAAVPVLARGIVLDEHDLYRQREAGADGVILHPALLEPARITALRKVARSMRIEALVECFDDEDLSRALASEATLLAVSGVDAAGARDLARAEALLERVPRDRTPILTGGVFRPEDLVELLPLVDAVVLVEPLMAAAAGARPVGPVVEPFTTLV